MKPTLASIRRTAMKQGKTLPIWTEDQWTRKIEERKNRKLDLSKLIEVFAPAEADYRRLESRYGKEVANGAYPSFR